MPGIGISVKVGYKLNDNNWIEEIIQSYINRNSHIPEVYIDSNIRPFLEVELQKSYYEETFGDSTIADWFMVIEMISPGEINECYFDLIGTTV